MTKLSVVILNYNGEQYLRQFLPTVLKYSQRAKVIVIDNASGDSSVETLKRDFPEVEQIVLKENKGFAGGYNEALSGVDSEYYVLLNSDVEVTEGWLDPIVDLLEGHPEVAAAQPKIRSFKDRERFEYAGGSGGFIDFLGYPFCRGRLFDHAEKDTGQYDDEREVFWASGACLFIRSKVFHQLGAFDETFFAHMEEIDLCWRINNAGLKVMICPVSVVYHVGAGTLPVTNPKKTFLNFTNNLAMITKNLPLSVLLVVLPVRWVLDVVACLKFLFDGLPSHSMAVVKAQLNFLSNLPDIWQKRLQNRRLLQRGTIYPRSIVFDYFLLGKKRFKELNF